MILPGRRRLLLGALGGLVLPAGAAQVEKLGTRLATVEALDFDGRKQPIPVPGRPTVVNFWASWCAPCRVEMPLLQQMADFYGDRLTLQLVNFKERANSVKRHMQSAAWTFPTLLDPTGEVAAAWSVKIFPTTFGFDAQGQARWRVRGEYDWSNAEAGRLVEGLWS